MAHSTTIENYIFNCLVKYNSILWKYREDALQEIRLAILISEDEKDSLRTSGRLCYEMLKGFGAGKEFTCLDTPFSDSGKSREDYLPGGDDGYKESCDDNNNDLDSDIIKQAIALYGKYKCAKEVCWHLGINYNKQVENYLPNAYISNI